MLVMRRTRVTRALQLMERSLQIVPQQQQQQQRDAHTAVASRGDCR